MFVLYLDLTQVICQEISDNSDDKLYNKQIYTVCEDTGNDSYKCTCFSISKLEDEIIENLVVCGKHNDDFHRVFEYCWNQQIISSGIKNVKEVSFDSVYKLVWKKTIAQCQLLLFELNDNSVPLKEIESLYHLFIPKDKMVTLNENERQCQLRLLSLQLSSLCNAMHYCYPSSQQLFPAPDEWVPQTVDYIALYIEIVNDSKCTEAANLILKVKASLQLKGDFKIIESLTEHVRVFYVCMIIQMHACNTYM